MSQIYVSGPAFVWVGVAVENIASPYDPGDYGFFGFTERGLSVEMRPLTEDVKVDYAGEMPADVSLLGIDARIKGTFTRYNESVLRNLMSSLNGVEAGFGPRGAVGTLMQSEKPFFGATRMAGPPLLIYSSYGFKAELNNGSEGMIKAFRFYSAYVSEPLPQVLSTRRKAPEISWRAIPAFGHATSNDATGSTFVPNQAPYDAFQLFAVDESSVTGNLPGVN